MDIDINKGAPLLVARFNICQVFNNLMCFDSYIHTIQYKIQYSKENIFIQTLIIHVP